MSSPQQPVRAPTGLPYGDHAALEQQQQAAPLPQGGPLGEQATPPDAGGASPVGAQTGDLAALLSGLPSQRPEEHITTGNETPVPPSVVSAEQLATALEQVIQSGPVSQGLMNFYLDMRAQSRTPGVPPKKFAPGQQVPAYKILD